MTSLPCFECGSPTAVSLDLEAEVALCETCTLEFYNVEYLEEVLV